MASVDVDMEPEAEPNSLEYRLGATLTGHEKGVRDVAVSGNDVLVTLEERGRVSVWRRKGETGSFHKQDVFRNKMHEGLAYTVEMIYGAKGYPPVVFVSGGGDKTARIWTPEGQQIGSLIGHTNSVNSVSLTADGRIITGSWDGSAIVWEGGNIVQRLTGHSHAVAVLGLASGEIVTGSVNKSIIIFSGGVPIKTIQNAHAHAVRRLVVHPLGFASCSNDGFVKIWSNTGELLQSIAASHLENADQDRDRFVYGLTVLTDGNLVSCGEDCTVRIFSPDGGLVQSIQHPSPVYSVQALPNGDFVSGCTDKVARIFTKDAGRAASAEAQAEFQNWVQMAHSADGMEELDSSKLSDESVLLQPGASDGAIEVVNLQGKAMAYKWSSSKMEWEMIGEAIGRGRGGAQKKKPNINGVEYDFVTEVFVTDDKQVQMGFNRDDDPDEVARNFCTRWGLPPDVRAQIVEHVRPKTDAILHQMKKQNEAQIHRLTSFTYLPAWKSTGLQLQGAFKAKVFFAKMIELNTKIWSTQKELAMNKDEVATLGDMVANLSNVAGYPHSAFPKKQEELFSKLLDWPTDKVLPVLDAYRVLSCHVAATTALGSDPTIRAKIFSHVNKGTKTHLSLVLKGLANWVAKRTKSPAERKNPVLPAPVRALVLELLESVAIATTHEGTSVRAAYISFVYNVSLWLGKLSLADPCDVFVVIASGVAQAVRKGGLKANALFFALVCLGTMGFSSEAAKDVIKVSVDVQQLVADARKSKYVKVNQVAEEVARVYQ